MARKKFTLPPRCPYCAHKLRADGTCQNPECARYSPSNKDQVSSKESLVNKNGDFAENKD